MTRLFHTVRSKQNNIFYHFSTTPMIVTINVHYQNQTVEKVMRTVVNDGMSLSFSNIVSKPQTDRERALVVKLRQVYSCVALSGKQS